MTKDKAKYEGIYNATFILGVNTAGTGQDTAVKWLQFLSDPVNAAVYANGTSQHLTVKNVDYTNADLKHTAPWLPKKTLLAPRFQFNNLDIRNAVEAVVRRRRRRHRSRAGGPAGAGRSSTRSGSDHGHHAHLAEPGQGSRRRPTPSRSPRAATPWPRIRPCGCSRSPRCVLYIAFFVIPTIQGVVYAVTDWDGFSPTAQFVGLDNFTTILTSDDLFRNALSNNIKFMLVVVIFQTIFSLALGVYLTKNSKSSVALRSLYFFPTILSSVSVAFIWKFVYDPNFGLSTPCWVRSGWTASRAPSSATTTRPSTGSPSPRCGSTSAR